MKIVYCLNSIRYVGGIQRVTVVKANALSSLPGNEVYILVSDNAGGELVEPLSASVHLVDLGVDYYSDDWKSGLHVLWGIFVKRLQHRRRLAAALRRIRPDVVVSVGQSEKNFLPRIRGGWKTVREFHFVRDYRRRQARGFLGRVLAFCGSLWEDAFSLRRYDRIVVPTREDREANWRGWDKVSVIPNPLSFRSPAASSLEARTVVSVGRLSMQKNYGSLLRVFRRVADAHPGWRLEIWGTGGEEEALKGQIAALGLEGRVSLMGFTSDVRGCLLGASLFVSTSVFEGFHLALVEAMECGLPVVSYACPCGPRDIVTDGADGFLVEVGDERGMAERVCRLMEDAALRRRMGLAAREKAASFAVDSVIAQWTELFGSLVGDGE